MPTKILKSVSRLRAVEILNRAPLFKPLNAEDKSLLAIMPGLFRAVPKHSQLITEGEHDNCLYVLLAGKAQVKKNDTTLAQIEPGDFVGEVAFVTQEQRTATVIAEENLVVLSIDPHRFRKLPMRMREVIKDQIIKGLEKRISSQNDELTKYRNQLAQPA